MASATPYNNQTNDENDASDRYTLNRQRDHIFKQVLTEDGWEVFMPIVDHDKKTDLLVADDKNFYRIQVKALNSIDEDIYVDNKWKGKDIDYVLFFSVQGNWG